MSTESWETVSSRARALLNYGIVQTEWLQRSRMARFIAEVPYLAGCSKAAETSFAHLLIYLASIDDSCKEVFFHKPEDDGDLYTRLTPLLSFSGGNKAVLDCCRDLLALCMVSNYLKDTESDRAIGKYNPLNEGAWNGETLIRELSGSVTGTISPEISVFYTVEEALRGTWQD